MPFSSEENSILGLLTYYTYLNYYLYLIIFGHAVHHKRSADYYTKDD